LLLLLDQTKSLAAMTSTSTSFGDAVVGVGQCWWQSNGGVQHSDDQRSGCRRQRTAQQLRFRAAPATAAINTRASSAVIQGTVSEPLLALLVLLGRGIDINAVAQMPTKWLRVAARCFHYQLELGRRGGAGAQH
jgi:hypothetical protein